MITEAWLIVADRTASTVRKQKKMSIGIWFDFSFLFSLAPKSPGNGVWGCAFESLEPT